MGDLASRRSAVAFWTLLSGVALTVLATVTGNLAPAVLPSSGRDILGFMALGLVFIAHALPLVAGLTQSARTPALSRLIDGRA